MIPTDTSKTPPVSLRDYLPKDAPPTVDSQHKAPEPRTTATSLRDPAAIFGRATAVASVAAAMLFAGDAGAQTPAAPAQKPKPDAAKPEGQKPKPAASGDDEVMPEVVVRGEGDADPGAYRVARSASPLRTEPLLDIPQTITIVPQAVIQQQNATTLRDVLRNVPGISIQAGEGGVPAGDNLSIRGFAARTDIFVDNIRDIGGYTRDPFNIEQVEVTKGPASAYTGRGSTGGSVNVVTKAPKLDQSFDGSFGIGSHNFKRGTLDFNQPLSEFAVPGSAFRFNAMWTESEIAGRDKPYSRRWGLAPSLIFGLNTDTQLSLNFSHLEQDNLPDYGIPWVSNERILPGNPIYTGKEGVPPVKYSNYYGLTGRDYELTRTDIATLTLDHKINDIASVHYAFRYGRNDRDSVITAPRFLERDDELVEKLTADPNAPLTDEERAAVVSTDIERELKSRDQVDEIFANQINGEFLFETFGWKHTLIAGFDSNYETSENYVREGPEAEFADLFNPNPGDRYPGSIRRTGEVTEVESTNYGIYLFDTIKFNEQWELNGGLRWDYVDTEATTKAPGEGENGEPITEITNLGRTDKELSGRVGLVYKPLPNGSVYAAYGTSFNPSAEGLALDPRDVNLAPESSRTYEVGTKWDLLDKKLAVNAAVFRTEKTNARTVSLVPDDPERVLDGEQFVQGFEVGIAGRITRNWSVFGGYCFLDSEVESSNDPKEVGKNVSNTPDHTFSFWTTYSLPWDIEVGAGVQYVGRRFANLTNTREAEGYWLVDAMISKRITQNISARLNVTNLADEEYIDRVGGGHFVPGAGRTAILTVNFDF